ncbi:MAG: hypothetical protein R3272_00875 [Candidatus Promineifilaceae bacterium]|nr:hypothetical protein [Candidatus Promineifilaceae bacterium]
MTQKQKEPVRHPRPQRERFVEPRRLLLLLLLIAGALLTAVAGCAPALTDPPRLATATARAQMAPTPTPSVVVLPAPTPTGEPFAVPEIAPSQDSNPTVTLWVNRTAPQYQAALETMIENFSRNHPINVELMAVAPDLLPGLIETASLSSTFPLPDVVLLPLEYTIGWSERGILDVAAADAIVEELGPDTFNEDALDLVTVDGRAAAIPSDGWQQLLIYRSDWFAEQELAPPDSFEKMLTAAEAIHDPDNLIYSVNLPTESSLYATSHRFEQLAIANGCQIINEQGELQILEPACQEALEFYRFFCNTYCPPGVQTEVSALNSYLSGRSGLILASPAALPAIAGLDESYAPTCAECEQEGFLAENTGFVTTITGSGPQAAPQNFGQITYLGITSAADQEATEEFVRYWFNEGYLEWLAVEPAQKVPMRLGTREEPRRFIDAWHELPLTAGERTLDEIFGRPVAEQLAQDLVNTDRWGYKQGAGALMTTLYEDLTISILLQELLSGYYDSPRAAIEGYKRLVDLIPDYEFYVDPEAASEASP